MSTKKLTGRIEARTTLETKELIEAAAAIEGRTISDFIVASAAENARRVLQAHRVLFLNREDSIAFAEALIAPPEPVEALKHAVQVHNERMKQPWNYSSSSPSTNPSTTESPSAAESQA